MYNSDTELIFPSRIIPGLRDLRGEKWQQLIDAVSQKAPESLEYTAFVLMMARMNGCVSCNVDSYRAMRGCTQCAHQSLRRFRGDDQELVTQFELACQEVKANWEKDEYNNH
jgi:hypothetical protein